MHQLERDTLSDRVTTVLGFSQLLLEEGYGPLTDEQKRVLEEIVQAATELKDQVRADCRGYTFD